MTSSRRLGLLLGGAALLLAACGGDSPAPPSPTPYRWTGAQLVHPLAKPEFNLTDQRGQPFDFQRDSAGHVTLLYFGYTHCPDICPENMSMLAFALKDMPAADRARVQVVFVTTDPARDTPAVLASWLSNYNEGFIGLTGSKTAIDVAQIQARVSLASPEPASPGSTYYVDHAAQIIAYTPDNLAHIAFFQGMSSAKVAHDLERLVTHGWT
ncbi:MAG: SCO family protein [Candidatus Dormibacteria bacterium]